MNLVTDDSEDEKQMHRAHTKADSRSDQQQENNNHFITGRRQQKANITMSNMDGGMPVGKRGWIDGYLSKRH